MMRRWMLLIAFAVLPLGAENRLSVTVVDAKTGKPAVDLKADDFTLYEDKLARKVNSAEFSTEPSRRDAPARHQPGRRSG